MSIYQGIDLTGQAELIKKLKQISTKTGSNALKKALRKAGNKIRTSVKGEAPEVTGNLKRSIKVFNDGSNASKGGALVRVGADRRIAPHAHLVEFGTVERELTKPSVVRLASGEVFTITETGRMPANNFFERGYNSSKDEAIQLFITEITSVVNHI